MCVVEARVELPTEPMLTAPDAPPCKLKTLVVLVEPMVTVWAAAPVANWIV